MTNYTSDINDRELKIGQYFSRGWEIFKQYPGGFIGFLVITFLISGIASRLPFPLGTNEDGMGGIVNIVVTPVLSAGTYIVAFLIAKNRPKQFSDFFRGFNQFLQIFLANLVSSVLIGIASLLLLIPGIYLAIAYMFSLLFVIEKKMSFWSAMEASRTLITKKWFSFLVFAVTIFLLNLAGLVVLGLGLLVTIPLTYCIMVAAFEDIVGLNGVDNNAEDIMDIGLE
ncbi:hypothetical protein [Mastigocoleus testarum]|uniref:Glycerophosphoryl diester phosphodiesterase membrane domain-containing protein n=1 Tax=Mastigocoleus testarum BC008 TaxID=371196 RepID=A0A0V7ZJ68_9CYAN|nr:hypothetical protein [Mastigocoleus testarum]KST63476.1 hypothetical protein BC008_13510 [Mastigocoleus testarum BC008]KST64608.1 hypothetical protein BC008_18450 [Mastigocoleus testarum BC008]